MTSTLLTLLLAAGPATPQAQPVVPPVSGTAEIGAFVTALDSCTAAKAATPHPLMTSFVIQHTIVGSKETGCEYRQTMPGNMQMVCLLSVEGRKALAAELSVFAKGGTMHGSSSGPQPAWTNECEIEMPNGTRSPLGRPR